MTDGIPIVYYGLEQAFTGGADPANREALWPSGYPNTTAVEMITKLNKLRNWMINTDEKQANQRKRTQGEYEWQNKFYRQQRWVHGDSRRGKSHRMHWRDYGDVSRRDGASQHLGFINSTAEIVGASDKVMGIVRGSVIGVVTNIGSPVRHPFDLFFLSFHALTTILNPATELEFPRTHSLRSQYGNH
jgi:hypothetical protein